MTQTYSLIHPRTMAGRAAAVAAGALAIAVAAQIRAYLPFTPVPITLQVLAVIASGLLLGPWMGACASAAYLLLGMSGAPVWAGGNAGAAYLLAAKSGIVGASAGYLLAFPLAAMMTGMIWQNRTSDSYPRAWVAAVVGVGIIYAGGFGWLAWQLAGMLGTSAGLQAAFAQGVVPFVGIDVLKALVAASMVAGGHKRLVAAHQPA